MSIRTTWVGRAAGGGAAVLGGFSAHVVEFFNLAHPSVTMKCFVGGLRGGAVVHIGGGISLALLTGVKTKDDVVGLTGKGIDFAIDVGARFDKFIEAGGLLATGLKTLQKVNTLPDMKVWASSEAAKAFINGLTGDLNLSHSSPNFAMFGLPAGAGVGAGIWYEYQKISAIGGPRAWDFFKPFWRITKHNGKVWLQIADIPAEDGENIIVKLREGTVMGFGRDNPLELRAPNGIDVLWGLVRDQCLFEDTKTLNLGNNAPPYGGLDLTSRTLDGRWTPDGIQALAKDTHLIGIETIVGNRTAWKSKEYCKVTTDLAGDIDSVINGKTWQR